MEEEREPNEMEPSSIFDQLPVTLGDSEDQVSHQTAAGEEEEGAAAEQATAAEGHRDDSRTKVSTQISTPENQKELAEAEHREAIRIRDLTGWGR